MENFSQNIEPELAVVRIEGEARAADTVPANISSSDSARPGQATQATRRASTIGVKRRSSEYDRETAREFDQYYTDPVLAAAYMETVKAKIANIWEMTLIEPSAGDGSFSIVMPAGSIAMDIYPRGAGIREGNFLEWRYEGDRKVGFVGNPPFGRCSNKAHAFIKHAAQWATFIAFVLPRTFKKERAQAKINGYFHLIHEEPVPDHAFLFCGEPYNVPAVFQIWQRFPYPRELPSFETEHPDFVFTKPERADFAIQRVGANAGKSITISTSVNLPTILSWAGSSISCGSSTSPAPPRTLPETPASRSPR